MYDCITFPIGDSILWDKVPRKKFQEQEELSDKDRAWTKSLDNRITIRYSLLVTLRNASVFQDVLTHHDFYSEPVPFDYLLLWASFHPSGLRPNRSPLSICYKWMLWSLARHSLGRKWRVKLHRACVLLHIALFCGIPGTSSDLLRRSLQY